MGHQTMTFVANEQRLRKHMNTTTLSTTTTRKGNEVFYDAPSPNLTCFSFRLQLQETFPSSSFLAILLLTLLCQSMREVEMTRDHVQEYFLQRVNEINYATFPVPFCCIRLIRKIHLPMPWENRQTQLHS